MSGFHWFKQLPHMIFGATNERLCRVPFGLIGNAQRRDAGNMVKFPLRPRMILALLVAADATGWLHLRPDVVVLLVVEGALHPIEQSTPVGGDR